QLDDDLAEAVDALRDALDEALGDDRVGLCAFREMHDLAYVAAGDAARAAHDVDDVVVALGGDEAELRAAMLDDGIGADRGAVARALGRPTAPGGVGPERPRGRGRGFQHALAKIMRGGGRFRGDARPRLVDHHAIGEGAADIDADEVGAHPRAAPAPALR